MKRFVALVGVVCILVGLRLDQGIFGLRIADDSLLTVFCDGYEITVSYGEVGALDSFSSASSIRIDTYGGASVGYDVVSQLDANLHKTEYIGDITILYAYSPRLPKSVHLSGKKTNLMIAITPSAVIIGYPLIEGSY